MTPDELAALGAMRSRHAHVVEGSTGTLDLIAMRRAAWQAYNAAGSVLMTMNEARTDRDRKLTELALRAKFAAWQVYNELVALAGPEPHSREF